MNRIQHLLASFSVAVLVCSCSGFKLFTGRFLYFNAAASSSTSIDSEANLTGQYMVHYSGTVPDSKFTVNVSAIPGDGLEEGVDYELVTAPVLTFLPGVFEMPFRVKWMSHPLDKSRECRLVLRIESCSDAEVNLGYPGPDSSMQTLVITKY